MKDLQKYNTIVESCIKKIGVDPSTCYNKQNNEWSLKKGSANVIIGIYWMDINNAAYIRIYSPFMQLPKSNKEAFYKELLDMNLSLYGVYCATGGDWAYVADIREVDGIDENEVMSMLQRIGTYADDLDDKLTAKYK